jgi:hypothetical protein
MRLLLLPLSFFCLTSPATLAQSFQTNVAPLIEASCIGCHDADTETDLNLEALGHDLADAKTFRSWENVFDRVHDGEMPPASEDRPDPKQLSVALASLKQDLRSASIEKQERIGRVPARRLTRLEFGYTLRDLLLIDSDVTSGIPDEVESGSFDTVGATQRISSVHMESYLQAADEALNLAINLGRNPYRDFGDHANSNFAHLEEWHNKPLNLGGSVTRKLKFGKGIALFADIDYLTQFTYGVSSPGIFRLTAKVAAYQSQAPVTAKFIVKDPSGGARLVKAVDLQPGEPETVVLDTFLKPGETPYLTFDQGRVGLGQAGVFGAGGAKNYKGPGLAILSQKIEGPLTDTWPPPSTRRLFDGMNPTDKVSRDPLEHVTHIVKRIAPRAFRREVTDAELEPFIDLAKPAVEAGRDIVEVLHLPLRSMLSSPQFLLFDGEAGELDDYALANRLAYFLWKSMPDAELFALAKAGKLSDPKLLGEQVDRMLADDKSNRFVRDYLGQWLRLNKVNVTSPDAGLYPEFDELLSNAIPQETELFFANLIEENLSLSNLIDADFTFVNRRLAEHYGIEGVEGQEFRKIELPADSLRGGVLTQAAILKTTANGTTTSPVTRGNFVLSNFLGTPPSPPPPGIGSIEPDTRGQTTIREILNAHRNIETCNQCHREIDPPGFALESFDPIGGFRTYYRASGGEQKFGDLTIQLPPKQGPPVDPAGVTAEGRKFSGIEEFKQLLLDQKEQVARNFISQLVVYATGGEIEFADREEIEAILNRTGDENFPVKNIIHQVIQSKMFTNK